MEKVIIPSGIVAFLMAKFTFIFKMLIISKGKTNVERVFMNESRNF